MRKIKIENGCLEMSVFEEEIKSTVKFEKGTVTATANKILVSEEKKQ